MNITQKTDAKLDPFFKRHGLLFTKCANILAATAEPVLLYATYRYGSQASPDGSYSVQYGLPVIIYALLCMSLFGRYTKRYERQTNTFSLYSIGASLVASLIVMLLSFPGAPLSTYWAVPDQPISNVVFAAPVVIALIVAGATVLHQRRKASIKL